LNDILLEQTNGTEPLRIARSGGYIPQNLRQYHDHLGIVYRSDFARSVGAVMIVPTEPGVFGSTLKFIIGPTEPQSFCFDNSLITIPIYLNHSNLFRIPIAVSLVDTRSNSPVYVVLQERFEAVHDDFALQTSHKTTILPYLVRSALREIIAERFGPVDDGMNGEFYVAANCQRMIAELPSISFAIHDSIRPVYQVLMTPGDYVSSVEGRCRIHVSLDSNTPTLAPVLGQQFFERVGVLLDYHNSQIGFCDPL